jgi:hypothetical protein
MARSSIPKTVPLPRRIDSVLVTDLQNKPMATTSGRENLSAEKTNSSSNAPFL